MFGTKYLYDEHDCNVVSMNSLNIHDANDMQSPKLGDAMFNEDNIFSLPSFDEQIYYDESMPPIYDDYCDDTYAIKNNDEYIYKIVMIMITLFLNITLLMWKQFIVFNFLMIPSLFRMRRNLLMWRV